MAASGGRLLIKLLRWRAQAQGMVPLLIPANRQPPSTGLADLSIVEAGIPGEESAFTGSPALSLGAAPYSISAAGIPSAQTAAAAAVSALVQGASIRSAQALGPVVVAVGAQVGAAAIGSLERTSAAAVGARIGAVGIPGAQAVGPAQARANITAGGIKGGQASGPATVTAAAPGVLITAVGIPGEERAFTDSPALSLGAAPYLISAGGIPSAQASGPAALQLVPVVEPPVTQPPIGGGGGSSIPFHLRVNMIGRRPSVKDEPVDDWLDDAELLEIGLALITSGVLEEA